MGVLSSLCKLGVEITRSKFKMQEMAEMLIQDRADQVSGDRRCWPRHTPAVREDLQPKHFTSKHNW